MVLVVLDVVALDTDLLRSVALMPAVNEMMSYYLCLWWNEFYKPYLIVLGKYLAIISAYIQL